MTPGASRGRQRRRVRQRVLMPIAALWSTPGSLPIEQRPVVALRPRRASGCQSALVAIRFVRRTARRDNGAHVERRPHGRWPTVVAARARIRPARNRTRGVSNEAKRNLGRHVSALDPLADASRYGRHRPWDIEGRALKHCAGRPRGLPVRDARARRTAIGARHHAARRVVRGRHARHPHEGAHYGEIARSTGGFFFVWTLWALGGLGGVTFILSARGLWSLRRRQPR